MSGGASSGVLQMAICKPPPHRYVTDWPLSRMQEPVRHGYVGVALLQIARPSLELEPDS